MSFGKSCTDGGGGESQPTVCIAGVTLHADLSGALYWEEQQLLVVSDLHLEKGSSFAMRGTLLPPYDTIATLGRLGAVIARHDPRTVIALGDSFHDRNAHERLSQPNRCFASDGERAIMPAFGAYTGGLNIRDAAFARIFQTLGFVAHVLGDRRLHAIAASRCH
jgi:metallophosphoesterase superfamily enzyme